MMVADHLLGKPVGPFVYDGLRLGVAARAGADDQRRAGIVDENVVGFIDQAVMMAALNLGIERLEGLSGVDPGRPKRGILPAAALGFQAVAQEVEAELRGGAIG